MLRIALYAGGALAGVYLVNELHPVKLDPAAAVDAAGAGVDTALEELFHGNWGAAGRAFVGAGKSAGGVAQNQVQGQVRTNVVMGVVGGCVVAGLVDGLLL